MTGRLVVVVLAACAGVLASEARVTFRAEESFERGLSLVAGNASDPAADVAGRLEAYEEAMRRDPGEALYVRRAGQVRLRRARRADGTLDREELARATALLVRAAELRPVDGVTHAFVAQALRTGRDPEGAVRAARMSVRMAPRSAFTLRNGVVIGLSAWRTSGSTDALRFALESSSSLVRIGESRATNEVVAAFADTTRPLAADLVHATIGSPALRTFAADVTRSSHPEVAGALDAARERGR